MMNIKIGIAAAALLGAMGAQAQMVERDVVDKQVWGCLQQGSTPLRLTHEQDARRPEGTVRVSIKFTAPDKAPEVEVIYPGADDDLVQKVWFHVRGYRLPCLAAGAEPVMAVQEFTFRPKGVDPIIWSSPSATSTDASGPRPDHWACLRMPRDRLIGDDTMRAGRSNLVLNFTFDHPQQAPKVKVVYSSVGESMEARVLDYVRQYRLPCLTQGEKPYEAQQQFAFQLDTRTSGGKPEFKEAVSLRTFLGLIKDIKAQKVNFDFRTMSCPFQVVWRVGKPVMDNGVGEVGQRDLNRTEFLAWLAGLEMNLQKPELESLLGEPLRINVSCGRLTLGTNSTAPGGG